MSKCPGSFRRYSEGVCFSRPGAKSASRRAGIAAKRKNKALEIALYSALRASV